MIDLKNYAINLERGYYLFEIVKENTDNLTLFGYIQCKQQYCNERVSIFPGEIIIELDLENYQILSSSVENVCFMSRFGLKILQPHPKQPKEIKIFSVGFKSEFLDGTDRVVLKGDFVRGEIKNLTHN